ncbi:MULTISPECIES: O-antigen ligase family protein [Dyella]|uniref:O-antigen ligase-related domain-containing protein n=2 Tax=Dyella TaxID=231454 RepID=A0A4R0YIX2_9GAMM|nr:MULTISPECIES: O-antigen ligase family protein [Dyella]TBR36506.1 hypothetical protein EYV96_11250 [Dyella terrae]TCI08402.1 hypothetical protein EZM97_27620 [Dyella soli]
MSETLLNHQDISATAPAPLGVAGWLCRVLIVGMAWLILGMAFMPAGVSYNPGKLYQRLLGLTLYLPAFVLLLMQPRRIVPFWRQSLMPWVLLLLAWASVTLFWGHAGRKEDVLGHNVSIVLFLFAWQQALGGQQDWTKRLLVICGLGMAVAASIAIVLDLINPVADARLEGFGVMANANLAAGGMGAALMWLWPWRADDKRWMALKWVAIAVLAFGVLLTFARSAMAAMFLAVIAMTLCTGGRRAWWFAGALAVLALVGMVAGADLLLARGLSLRPEIFARATTLFLEHPWLGVGQGTPIQLTAGHETLTHAHNMFSQLAIELGLPGLLLWTGIWLAVGWKGWTHRHDPLGRVVLGLWLFGTVLVQFDLPYLLASPRPTWLFTWLPLALCLSLEQRSLTPSANPA